MDEHLAALIRAVRVNEPDANIGVISSASEAALMAAHYVVPVAIWVNEAHRSDRAGPHRRVVVSQREPHHVNLVAACRELEWSGSG